MNGQPDGKRNGKRRRASVPIPACLKQYSAGLRMLARLIASATARPTSWGTMFSVMRREETVRS
jgi:hypothetical protein